MLSELTLQQAQEMLRSKKTSAHELTTACFSQIEKYDHVLNSFLTLDKAGALKKANEIDMEEAYNKPLAGIPIAIKDILVTKNLRTTAGSKILEHYNPPYSATVVEKIETAGGIIIGKTNLDEFAMGSSGENSAFGPTKNPWDITRISGGSSSGSTAAVASYMAFGSLGSDTGGSIRQPACLSGIVGMKPTYGRVSRFGSISMASSLDQIGTFGRTVYDAALLLSVIAGEDPQDATSMKAEVPPYHALLNADVRGLKIGIPQEYMEGGLGEEERTVVLNTIQILKNKGVEIIDISLPHSKYAISVYYIIMACEVSANLSRYDGIRYGDNFAEHASSLNDIYVSNRSKGFGPEPKRRIMLGAFSLSSGYQDQYYIKAQKVRTLIRKDFDEAFKEVDVILTPVSPTPAWKIGEKVNDPLKMYFSDIYTVPASLAGICGLAVPAGLVSSLPFGVQILGAPLQEQKIFNVGYALEQEIQFYKQKPTYVR